MKLINPNNKDLAKKSLAFAVGIVFLIFMVKAAFHLLLSIIPIAIIVFVGLKIYEQMNK